MLECEVVCLMGQISRGETLCLGTLRCFCMGGEAFLKQKSRFWRNHKCSTKAIPRQCLEWYITCLDLQTYMQKIIKNQLLMGLTDYDEWRIDKWY